MITKEKIELIKAQHTKEFSDLQLRKIVEILEKEKITLLSQHDILYPKCFLELKKPPALLYIKGTIPSNWERSVTIVGTRHATHYGRQQAYLIAKELAAAGIPIVSGLARGIDGAVHQGALEGGITIAILGSGFCQLYPKEHSLLAEQIIQKGALISEYPPFTPASRYTFVQRNRLLASLGRAAVLIESPQEGGSMITMEMARVLGRALFALPGAVDIPSFKGNFQLIKNHIAQLLEGSQDIFAYFKMEIEGKKEKETFLLSLEEKKIFQLLIGEEKGLEELLLLTQYPIMQLNALLTSLLLKGAIEEFAGKLYKKRVS